MDIVGAIAVGHFDVTHPGLLHGFTFSSSGHLDTIANTIATTGLAAYERPATDIIIALVGNLSGMVLDIGANTGLFTLIVAASNPLIRVCAFEPLDSVRDLLAHNIALNPRLADRIAVESFGFSDKNGSFEFYETINNVGLVTTSSSLEKGHAERTGDAFVERTIETRTLDDFGDTLGPINVSLLKIDVEGHEYAVIAGARRFVAKHRPFLMLEVLGETDIASIDRLLIESNYIALAMAPNELRQCERLRFHADAWNHLLCPCEKADRLFSLCRQASLRITID